MNYQKIQIGDIIYLDGHDRLPEYKNIFPEPPKGKSILDLGCHTGFYVMQARYEGASFCKGIDISTDRIRMAKEIVANSPWTKIEFEVGDVSVPNFKCDKKFDYVLCMNILHHLSINGVENVVGLSDKVCKEKIIFVVAPYFGSENFGIIKTRGVEALGINPNFFFERFPNCIVHTQPTVVTPLERLIVTVNKNV